MKKPFFFLHPALLLAIALILSGCGGANTETVPTTEATVPVTTQATQPTETVLPTETEPLFPAPGDHALRFDSEATGDYLDYYLHVPEGATKNMPLVIFLHGDGEVNNMELLLENDMITNTREIYGDAFPFLVLTPCTRKISWVHDSIPDTLFALIGHVVEEYQIDREKIIITGYSRGAIGTWYQISEHGDYFSAAVPISCDCGDVDFYNEPHRYQRAAQVPVRAFVGYQGDLDSKYCPAMNHMCYMIRENGGDAELTVFWEYYHDATCNLAFTQDLFDWILAQ